MKELINTAASHQGQILAALGEHLLLSVEALLIACLLAIPLGMLLAHSKRAGEVVFQITSIIQTIPSLALLGLLIPLVGIGTTPALIALTAYGVMPIYQNTYSSLRNIDPNLEEAADAFGLSRWRKLTRLEFPMALPMILSGVSISLVMIIGTATLAAMIGAGGLGTYIMLGIQQNNNTYLLIGAGLSAILTLAMSALLKFMSSSKKHFQLTATVLAILALGLGVSQMPKLFSPKQEEVVIAGKMGSEPDILINMYKDLIEKDNPNVKVAVKNNFGGTSFLFSALKSSKIDIYPEFTGTVLQGLVKEKVATPHDPAKTYQLAKKLLAKEYQLSYLKPMKYQNGYDLAVTKTFSKKHDLKTLSDLAKLDSSLTAAFDPDFTNQQDGYLGLKKAYGLNLQVKTMESALRYKAIASGKAAVVDGYTTDPEIRQYGLVALKDDKKFFPPYQGAPLMKTSFAKKHPGIVKSLNKLAGKISEKDMQQMNYQVSVKHASASKVARRYLQKHGLL
ncbi:ABC transporter permease/substrate-binding protein [Lactobacillus nasalidis]|uniref:ABC transporter permease/substrate-binding protein n=1 Tax=Lactobacillus nasalidis TaxID=2797258 RepID=UPI001916677C|nr:ABC transporter permease/substrate-binding protein [Lactobacillus nasalidis]GHV97595.1 glycine/betaine ABC transporter permease [Lactobacillus nasalidis]GHV98890.1 glycine/betaine ABC transporter permease [Lactobacillus nasalidis]